MIAKCVTCQRSYDSSKYSVDCPHDVELSADLQRSTQVRPPVSVPPYQHIRNEVVDKVVGDAWDDSVKPEDITEEMIEKWEALMSHGRGAWDMVDHKELMAAAINVFLQEPKEV